MTIRSVWFVGKLRSSLRRRVKHASNEIIFTYNFLIIVF